MTCDTCGVDLEVGAWPFCPHGRPSMVVVPDEVPGGFWQENGFREPRKFYSRSECDRALAENGFERRVRHVPVPGTDKSPHTTDWSAGSIDAQTLENVRVLLTRGRAPTPYRPQDDPEYGPPIPITVTEGESFTFPVDHE